MINAIHNLANLLHQKSDLATAEPLMRRVLETRERILGPEHPSTLTAVVNLAGLLHQKDNFAAVEPLMRRALARDKREGTRAGASGHAHVRPRLAP